MAEQVKKKHPWFKYFALSPPLTEQEKISMDRMKRTIDARNKRLKNGF